MYAANGLRDLLIMHMSYTVHTSMKGEEYANRSQSQHAQHDLASYGLHLMQHDAHRLPTTEHSTKLSLIA
jgi:hypothetical protein